MMQDAIKHAVASQLWFSSGSPKYHLELDRNLASEVLIHFSLRHIVLEYGFVFGTHTNFYFEVLRKFILLALPHASIAEFDLARTD